ncbi:hypothetical protein AVEN_186842-1 [Araneus ventricosus]|uniref:Uncharacterized protein n=1 Tax=Araneus ventricosus TaxID=182803 RepID=A0A4Y2IIX5_ARAVE|nr:hypothetical protein AVEN_186842-1 [Araneus ventricosus]
MATLAINDKHGIQVLFCFQKAKGSLHLDKALFPRRVVDCGRWNSNQSRRKSLGSARVNGCTDAVWPLLPPLMCKLFTAITRETENALTSPRATSILSAPPTGNNTNRGRNSWEDRP